MKTSFWQDTVWYASQIKKFDKTDWTVYIVWVGLMLGLLFSTTGFVLLGHMNGVEYPAYVWNIPLGVLIFVTAISFDTIGHRTSYKEALKGGEALVHHITIFAGVTSCILLCLAYTYRDFFAIPALTMVFLSVFYSVIDEWMHWKRFMEKNSDRVEMWSHFFIFLGHFIFVFAWSYWFLQGYPGVAETVQYLPLKW